MLYIIKSVIWFVVQKIKEAGGKKRRRGGEDDDEEDLTKYMNHNKGKSSKKGGKGNRR